LLEPHSSIEDARPRNRARRLAILSLGLLVASVVVIIIGTGIVDFGLPLWAAIGIAAISYLLSRSPLPQLGAYVLVLGFLGVDLWLASTMTDPRFIVLILAFAPLPIVLSTLILDAGGTAVTAFIAINGLVVLDQLVDAIAFNQVVVPLVAVIFISIIAGVTAFLRERDLSTIESQNVVLDRFSKSVEEDLATMRIMVEIGQAISATRDLDQLLSETVNLLIERFDKFYHAQIFLLDEAEEYAVLQEATGEAGKKLLRNNHRFAVGSRSVIGTVMAQSTPMIIPDTEGDSLYRPEELLPTTRSEMVFPLIAGGQPVGALDLHSQQPDTFQETDLPRFQTMADQLAAAIENARLLTQAQNDLKEIEALNRQLTGEGWRRYREANPGATLGYEAVAGNVRPLTSVKPSEEDASTLHLPLLVRGETVGTLDVKSRSGEPPNEELQSVLREVAERVALALDSTRLSDNALRQIEREQVLSRLSADLQATTDLDVILRIAAREASRALGTSRGFVHLSMEYAEHSAQSEE
jgi:GAF domain-containing protein